MEFSDIIRAHEMYNNSHWWYSKVINLILKLQREVKSRDLKFVVIKGIGLNNCIYDNKEIRSFGDLDILVKPEDISEFNKVLNDMGYFQKYGHTSIGNISGAYGKALMAVNAQKYKSKPNEGRLEFPIKAHQKKPEYKAFCKAGEPNIEIHDGLYFLTEDAVNKILNEGVQEKRYKDVQYMTLMPEYAYVLLLTNTYENSESFFSNSYNFDANLRDYVDLRFFIKKYRKNLDWNLVERLIGDFRISKIAAVIIGNFNEIYGRDVTLGCLPEIEPKASQWNVSIIERMADTKLARSSALKVMRKRWLEESCKTPVFVRVVSERVQDVKWKCSKANVLYDIQYNDQGFKLCIGITNSNDHSEYLYQFSFFSLQASPSYTSYKISLHKLGDEYRAYGHSSNRYNLGAVKKETKNCFPILFSKSEGMRILSIIIPFNIFQIDDIFMENCMCFSFDIYKQHYNEIYHNINGGTMGEKHLIRMEK